MREYQVNFDGAPRTLHYGLKEREWIEDQFRRSDGTPGSLGSLVTEHLIKHGSLRVQATIVAGGLQHLGDKWTVDKVIEEYGKATKTPEGIQPINKAAFKAILTSGVCGRVIEDPDEQGKEEPPAAQ